MTLVLHSPCAGFRLNAAPVRAPPFLLDGERVEIALHGPGSHDPGTGTLAAEEGIIWRLEPWRASCRAVAGASDGANIAPMPGRIIAVEVSQGMAVTKGQKLLTLEAMKMEHSLVAPFDGTVAALDATAGGQVSEGSLLARIEKDDGA